MNKSNTKSDSLRLEGNKLFYQKNYYDAMVKYNESLCFAETGSEMLGLAYANRSAVCFEIKLYDFCSQNIALAKQNKYPEVNADVLTKRDEKCLAMKQSKRDNRTTNMEQTFKLSYPSHKKIPFMAECLELKCNGKYGRHIVTNKNLKVGDVVAIEEPFCKIVQKEFIHQICSWCFNSNLMNLIPCPACTTAMFCSEECKAKADESYHKYECPINGLTSSLSSNLQMALRTFFTALSIFDESLDDLRLYLSENSDQKTVFVVDDPCDQRTKLVAINSLMANDEVAMTESIFEKVFQMSSKLNELWSKYGDFIANFLKRHIQIGTLNYHEIYVWPLKRGTRKNEDSNTISPEGSLAYQRGTIGAGSGIYPLCSLLNHHCGPNVSRVFINGKIIVIVQRPIRKGDQLFDNYGHHFTNVSKNFRQMELAKQYRFRCDCDACTNDWPLLPDLKIADKIGLNKAKKFCRELGMGDLNSKKAMIKYKELCVVVEKNQKNFPSLETCSIMQCAAAYLEMSIKPQIQFV